MSEDKITGTVSLEETAVRLLLEKHLTLTTAESCTGGMCASRIVNVSGASGTLMQGIVTYSNEAKEKYLHVKHETLLQHGAVSHETAYEMARGCVDVCGTDCGIGLRHSDDRDRRSGRRNAGKAGRACLYSLRVQRPHGSEETESER